MATLTVQDMTPAGLVPSYAAADVAGDEFANNGRVTFWVKNGGAGAITVTVAAVGACDQGFTHTGGGSVPNDGVPKSFGPFDTYRFNDADGLVQITYSGVTSVTVAAVRANT